MIPVWKPSIGQNEIDFMHAVFNEGYLGHGSYTDKFEAECAKNLSIDRSNLIACSTGHAALHLILNGLCSEGSFIGTPTFNNIADFQAVINNRCTPILLDSENPNSPYVSKDTLISCIKDKNINAFIAIDYASNLCPLKEYYEICSNYGVKLIYDAAHSFGSININRLKYCDAAMFSFDPIKTFTAIDGGIIYFKNAALISETKPKRFIGMQQNESKIKQNKRTWEYDCDQEGWRYHLSNIHSAVGLTQINRHKEIRDKRIKALYYMRELISKEDLPIEFYPWDEKLIPFMNVAFIPDEDKPKLRKYLEENSIQTGTHWKPGHLFTKFKSFKYETCHNAEMLYKKAISLPLYTDIQMKDINKVVLAIKNFYSLK